MIIVDCDSTRTTREHIEEYGEGHRCEDHHPGQGQCQRGKGDFDDDMTKDKTQGL